jgi:hypothetical protein
MHREEHFILLNREEVPRMSDNLKGLRWHESPLIEMKNPEEWCCLLYSHSRREYWMAEGIIQDIYKYRGIKDLCYRNRHNPGWGGNREAAR